MSQVLKKIVDLYSREEEEPKFDSNHKYATVAYISENIFLQLSLYYAKHAYNAR